MPVETNAKPEQKAPEPKPHGGSHEEKNVDRDGRERQPTEQTDKK
jgi:hypothetical protein